MRRHPTIYDIAKRAGVSPSTVSKVLNNKSTVSERAVKKVSAAIREMDYQRPRRSPRTDALQRLLAVVIPDLRNPFFAVLAKGISDVTRIHKYHLVVSHTENNPEIETEQVQSLRDLGVAGIIYVPTGGSPEMMRDLRKLESPVVFLDRVIDESNVHCVLADNNEGAYQATKYLLKLGHREIVYCGGSRHLSTERERFGGFRRALLEMQMDCSASNILEAEFTQEKAYEMMRARIRDKLDFTAVFASNDVMAYGIKNALEEGGYRIPEDVSLIGYDNIPFSATIGLTTVAQPAYEMGRNAGILAIDVLNGRVREPQKIVLMPSMVIRHSCTNLGIGEITPGPRPQPGNA